LSAERYLKIREQIPSGVVLVAVSKTQSVEAIEELYRLGQRDFGENYVQELVEKAHELERRGCGEVRWHFIGHLQSNKVKTVLPLVSCVHTVDSDRLANEIAKRWAALEREQRLPVMIEVNLDGETSKAGFSPDSVVRVVEKISKAHSKTLRIDGLMCIPAPRETSAEMRLCFARLRELGEQCRPWTQGKLSMGMSSDFVEAISEGATHVRIGTALFGPRPSG